MRIKVFTGSFNDGVGFALPGLDEFCDAVEVVAIATHFFEYAGVPRIAAVVTYRLPQRAGRPERESTGKDYREELDTESRVVFDALRTWRNDLARATGRAAFVLLTNRQLAELAKTKPTTLDAVRQIPGIGENRAEELGQSIVKVVQEMAAVSSGRIGTKSSTPSDSGPSSGGSNE